MYDFFPMDYHFSGSSSITVPSTGNMALGEESLQNYAFGVDNQLPAKSPLERSFNWMAAAMLLLLDKSLRRWRAGDTCPPLVVVLARAARA